MRANARYAFCAGLISIIVFFRVQFPKGGRVFPLISQELAIARTGPCVGQAKFATVDGLDLISAERARELAAASGLSVCIDIEPPVKPTRATSYFAIFSWPNQVHASEGAVFADEEMRGEATMLPASFVGNDDVLPVSHWITRGPRLPTSAPPEASHQLGELFTSRVYLKVSRKRVPSIVAVVKRACVAVWGTVPPFDFYIQFGSQELERFQNVPSLGLIYVGRMDPAIPSELLPGNLHLDP